MTENNATTVTHCVTVIMDEPSGESDEPVPDGEQLESCLRRWLAFLVNEPSAVSLKIAGESLSRSLNHQYRGIDKPTNVLSFPTGEILRDEGYVLLGDLLICHPVMVREAKQQGKALNAHYAHICIHGLLHLLGYDHESDSAAKEMESLEITMLEDLGFQNPYEIKQGAVP
ncbi:MAG: rRNA maturation RNase YbeY [Gammaproteobacteria bacterium]|nr:rRNA maturation RNase YbeY [Gammaproteobacteria bacterium]